MAKPIIEASQKNRDNLLQILLYKEYKQYEKEELNNGIFIDNDGNPYRQCVLVLTFDEWLEKILEEF